MVPPDTHVVRLIKIVKAISKWIVTITGNNVMPLNLTTGLRGEEF